MKYYHTNIVLQHETKLGFDFHILTRTLDFYLDLKKKSAAHFTVCVLGCFISNIARQRKMCCHYHKGVARVDINVLFTYLTL